MLTDRQSLFRLGVSISGCVDRQRTHQRIVRPSLLPFSRCAVPDITAEHPGRLAVNWPRNRKTRRLESIIDLRTVSIALDVLLNIPDNVLIWRRRVIRSQPEMSFRACRLTSPQVSGLSPSRSMSCSVELSLCAEVIIEFGQSGYHAGLIIGWACRRLTIPTHLHQIRPLSIETVGLGNRLLDGRTATWSARCGAFRRKFQSKRRPEQTPKIAVS